MSDLGTVVVPHEIYLLRHGETEWNREKRIQGQMDSPLTEQGQSQALRQGHTLKRLRKDLGDHRVFCSPLGRAQHTARLALGGDDFSTDKRLMEIGCGKWEGTCHDDRLVTDSDLAPNLSEDFDIYINAPGGEGLWRLSERLKAFLEDLQGPVVIFSHKIALAAMRAHLCGSELSSKMAPPQGSILEIRNGVARFHV